MLRVGVQTLYYPRTTSPILRRGGAATAAGNAGLTVELWRYSSSRTAIPGECATGGRVERTKREFLAYTYRVQREKLLLMQGLGVFTSEREEFWIEVHALVAVMKLGQMGQKYFAAIYRRSLFLLNNNH